MESELKNPHDSVSVRESLKMIGADRNRIGERMTAETWWAAPAQGLGVALIVGSPVAGPFWAWLPFVLSIGVFVGTEMLFRKRSGLRITRPAGRRGIWLLVALTLVIAFALTINTGLAMFGLTGWVVGMAVAVGAVSALIVAKYDRAYADEVRHAR